MTAVAWRGTGTMPPRSTRAARPRWAVSAGVPTVSVAATVGTRRCGGQGLRLRCGGVAGSRGAFPSRPCVGRVCASLCSFRFVLACAVCGGSLPPPRVRPPGSVLFSNGSARNRRRRPGERGGRAGRDADAGVAVAVATLGTNNCSRLARGSPLRPLPSTPPFLRVGPWRSPLPPCPLGYPAPATNPSGWMQVAAVAADEE